jgi:hypothetical protein
MAAKGAIAFIETGAVDWQELEDAIDENNITLQDHTNDIRALACHQEFTVSRLFETAGDHVLLDGGYHVRARVVNAYAVVHDNIEEEVHVYLLGVAAPIHFSSTERKGSAKEFSLAPHALHFATTLRVHLSASRRVSVYVTLRSNEEKT